METSDRKVPVLMGKRGSRRHSTMRVSEDVVVAETRNFSIITSMTIENRAL